MHERFLPECPSPPITRAKLDRWDDGCMGFDGPGSDRVRAWGPGHGIQTTGPLTVDNLRQLDREIVGRYGSVWRRDQREHDGEQLRPRRAREGRHGGQRVERRRRSTPILMHVAEHEGCEDAAVSGLGIVESGEDGQWREQDRIFPVVDPWLHGAATEEEYAAFESNLYASDSQQRQHLREFGQPTEAHRVTGRRARPVSTCREGDSPEALSDTSA